ncbi:hypothetical protein [Streptomyces minutiscleroticus]|nr:hypothetical protein [Streptomyces minutiscleroticus]
MGFWGYYVVGRSEKPLAGLAALADVQGMTLHEMTSEGWQVWQYPSKDGAGDVGDMAGLAAETGAPALFGYVMGGDCVVVEAAAPRGGAWTTCLARGAMAGHLGSGGDGPSVDDYFLEPRDAVARALAWAEEAGRTVAERPLLEVLSAEDEPSAEMLFFRFLDRLGVVPL